MVSDDESTAPRWVYGRKGMPVSPGVRSAPPPPRGPLSRRQEWFKDLKFGMFVHWGVESLVATHPELAPPEAPWSAPDFDARSLGAELDRLGECFDPAAWVGLARRAGQKYICFTARHHLGFANHASSAGDYNTAAARPHRDFLRLLADECHRSEMPLFVYLSLPDVHHPDFRPLDAAAWQRYEAYVLAQIEELAAGYSPLAGFWLDPGPWNGPSYRYPMARIEETVHQRFPEMLVGGRDWDGAEQSYDSRVFLGDTGLVLSYDPFPPGRGPQPDAWPFEVCDTLNRSWFHNPGDANYKNEAALVRRLVEVVGRGGNYLLNQGPLPSGELNPQDVLRLEAIGDWLQRNGEAIYRTRPLGMPPQPWGWPLIGKDAVYLHTLRWPGEQLVLSGVENRVIAARWLHGGHLDFESSPGGVTLNLPAEPPDPLDSIAVLEVAQAGAE